MREESGLCPWEFGGTRLKEELVKNNLSPVAETDRWKIGLLDKYITEKLFIFYNGLEENEELEGLIISLVS